MTQQLQKTYQSEKPLVRTLHNRLLTRAYLSSGTIEEYLSQVLEDIQKQEDPSIYQGLYQYTEKLLQELEKAPS